MCDDEYMDSWAGLNAEGTAAGRRVCKEMNRVQFKRLFAKTAARPQECLVACLLWALAALTRVRSS